MKLLTLIKDDKLKPPIERVVFANSMRSSTRAAAKTIRKKFTNRIYFTDRRQSGLFLCLGILESRKQVYVSFEYNLT